MRGGPAIAPRFKEMCLIPFERMVAIQSIPRVCLKSNSVASPRLVRYTGFAQWLRSSFGI